MMTQDKFTQKSVSTRISKGQTSVQKGTKFEDTVADVYRLLGAEVIQNIEICQKKVDILAIFRLPGSPTGHRVIVECKGEKKAIAQNQRVMQFKGLLETARKSDEADSAEIITRVPWSDQAKGFARKSGIALLTYTEKIAQLIDFTAYLKDIVDRFEKGDPRRRSEPPLEAYYVDLSAERVTKQGTERISVIDEYIEQWMLRNDTQQHLAILGEYGTGKTSLCQKLAHDLAVLYLKTPGSIRIPILFNLREFTKTLRIESLVTSSLDQECGVLNPRFKLFQVMNDAGIFVLIFDGFDEMATRVNVDTLEINLQEIEKLAASPKSKVIITSRPEYFISGEEQKRSLRPKGELLATRVTEYQPLKIALWDDKQVISFLKKRVPLIKEAKQPWTYYYNCIKDIPGLSDLSRRPVLLNMITKTLPQLITSGKPINRPNLYYIYLLGEIKRQKILKKRTLLLTEISRFSLLQHLALDFFVGEISAITFTDALKHVEEVVTPPKIELEAYTRDFLTCSFLIREGDEYQFSHKSIREYLVARGLMEEIEKNTPNIFNRLLLYPAVTAFLTELNPNTDTLWNWIKSTKFENKQDLKYLGGNAATLLCSLDRGALAERDLSGTALTGADLSSTDLRGANFSGTFIKNADLRYAQFLKKDLALARFSNVFISLFVFGRLLNVEKCQKQVRIKKLNKGNISKFLFDNFEPTMGYAGTESWSVGGQVDPNGYFLGQLEIVVLNEIRMQAIQKGVSSHPLVEAASLYADEHERLFAVMPKSLSIHAKGKNQGSFLHF